MDETTVHVTEEESHGSSILLMIGTGLLGLSGCIIFGNSMILISIRRFRRLQTLTNKFVFSLACADLSAGVTIIWQAVFNFNPELDKVGILCISRFIQIAPSYCSLMHLVIIATDRYLAILQPLRYHEFMTPKVAGTLIAIAWTMAITLTAIIVGTSRFVPGVTLCMMPDVTPPVILLIVFNIFFVIFLSAVLYLYTSIFLAARRQISQIQALEVTNKPKDKKSSNMAKELKAAKQLAFIVLVFIVTHGPGYFLSIVGFFYPLYMTGEEYLVYYKLVLLPMFFNSFMNPVVYALKSKEFKEAFKRILCRRLVPEGQREDSLGFDDSSAGMSRKADLTSVSKAVTKVIHVRNTIQTTSHA